MTLKEFAKKYGVPYSIVYNASCRVHVAPTFMKNRDFPADELQTAVINELSARVCKHHDEMIKAMDILARVKG